MINHYYNFLQILLLLIQLLLSRLLSILLPLSLTLVSLLSLLLTSLSFAPSSLPWLSLSSLSLTFSGLKKKSDEDHTKQTFHTKWTSSTPTLQSPTPRVYLNTWTPVLPKWVLASATLGAHTTYPFFHTLVGYFLNVSCAFVSWIIWILATRARDKSNLINGQPRIYSKRNCYNGVWKSMIDSIPKWAWAITIIIFQ